MYFNIITECQSQSLPTDGGFGGGATNTIVFLCFTNHPSTLNIVNKSINVALS
jgi:hypothetical protein